VPKSPRGKCPSGKSPSAQDPRCPRAQVPKSKRGKSPSGKSLTAQKPKCPRAQEPKCPRAQVSKSPSAQEPKCPRAQVPKSPSAKLSCLPFFRSQPLIVMKFPAGHFSDVFEIYEAGQCSVQCGNGTKPSHKVKCVPKSLTTINSTKQTVECEPLPTVEVDCQVMLV
jgi:hypothetical protein